MHSNDPMTGLPFGKKRTRRGRRRSPKIGNHFAHIREAQAHLKDGNYKKAKSCLFDAIKAMPGEDILDHLPAATMKSELVSPMKAKSSLSPAMRAFMARRSTQKKSP